MTNSVNFAVVLLVSVAVGVISPGCSDVSSDAPEEEAHVHADGEVHDHEGEDAHAHDADMPEDFASGVVALKDCYQKIKDAFEAEKPEDAHVPLHDVGDILGAVIKLARKADLAEADEETVTNAVGKMFDAYGKIDGAIHAGQAPDYAAVAEDLDSGMSELEGVIAKHNAAKES